MKYKLITSNQILTFEEHINAKLMEGWRLHGYGSRICIKTNTFAPEIKYFQAMTKEEVHNIFEEPY